MSDEKKISPLPWLPVLEDCYSRLKASNGQYVDSSDYDTGLSLNEEDALFIVKACNSYHANQQALVDKDKRIATFKGEVEILDIMIKELRELINKQLDLHIEHCGIDARLQNVEAVNRTIKQLLGSE
jgi:hypothetical protein